MHNELFVLLTWEILFKWITLKGQYRKILVLNYPDIIGRNLPITVCHISEVSNLRRRLCHA
jgi:hypothetical protein